MRFDALTIALCTACTVAPLVNFSGRFIDETVLGGVTEATQKPTFSLRTFLSEEWQAATVKWLESNYGFRSHMVRFDNTLTFMLTDEPPVTSRVRVGKDGVLFLDEDISYLNRLSETNRDVISNAAEQVRRVQELATRHGKSLIPVISPAKTSVVRDKIGARWRRANVDQTPSDRTYAAFVEELETRHVAFVDGRALLARRSDKQEPLWASGGRHWSAYAACLVFEEIVTVNSLLGSAVPLSRAPCGPATAVDGPQSLEDFDLVGLLNVLGRSGSHHRAVVLPEMQPAADATSDTGTGLIVGTSMIFKLTFEAERRHAFSRGEDLFYYNVTHVPWPPWKQVRHPTHPIDIQTEEWKATVKDSRVIIVEFAEWYLPNAEQTFLAQLEAALLNDGP